MNDNPIKKVSNSVNSFIYSIESSKSMFVSSLNYILLEMEGYVKELEKKVSDLTEEIGRLKKEEK